MRSHITRNGEQFRINIILNKTNKYLTSVSNNINELEDLHVK